MKIRNLEITKVRGIKSINLEPCCNNVVIFGPNGTGKSAIVDSVDFLLSGKISRLTGEGTKSITLREHGCHVDSRENLKDVSVKAKIEIDGNEIDIERSMHKPSELKVAPEKFEGVVDSYVTAAQQGVHILSRRQILQYITREAGDRSNEIMKLLDLADITAVRSTFVTIGNEAEMKFKQADSDLNVATREISNLLSLQGFSEEEALKKVNSIRASLQGIALRELRHDKFKAELKAPLHLKDKKDSYTTSQINNFIGEIKKICGKKEELKSHESELVTLLQDIIKEAKLKQYSKYIKLLESGIALVDETNICPLCERPWTEGNFKEHLERKKEEIEVGKEKQSRIDELSSAIKKDSDLLKNVISTLIKAHTQFGLEVDEKESKEYIELLDKWSGAMDTPLDSFEGDKWPEETIEVILTLPFTEERVIAPLRKVLEKEGEKYTEQVNAWDTLTKMEDRWKRYGEVVENWKECKLVKDRAKKSLEYFENSSDAVLDKIYGAIQTSFDSYYKTLHSEDEKNFVSKFSQEGAKLNFEVDFYDRGMFPPHAMHSEGHQDSMGLCLFLALNKHLTQDLIKVIVLDDVVMSIDRTHRRAICRLLRDFFPDRQFIITTHDSAWAKQLKTEGIVQKNNMIHFLNWNVETGPTYELEKDLWENIEADLQKDDLPAAAHKLRRNAECFFEDVCDLLSAKIDYKGHHQWDLGDFAQAAISAYKGYLKSAIKSARKMDQEEKTKELETLNEDANKIISESQVEQWVINKNVHFNKWEEFGKNDFEPVVQAFKKLLGLFTCNECGRTLTLMQSTTEPTKRTVNCGCGKFFWNVGE
jgi:recombinational DNA repair ATPase RecF